MTGRRPDTTQVYSNNDYWRDNYDISTFPQYLKTEANYTSVGLGMSIGWFLGDIFLDLILIVFVGVYINVTKIFVNNFKLQIISIIQYIVKIHSQCVTKPSFLSCFTGSLDSARRLWDIGNCLIV